MAHVRGDAAWGATLAVLLIAAVWCVHLPLLPVGGLSHYDEFYTFDRSVSFARMDDWLTVYSGNEPSFRKPPLQYWMTAGLLATGVEETVALRLPSMLFALGMLGVTAWLARILAPALPWAMPLAVGLLAGSLQFWTLANSALLDVGAGFVAALALAAAAVAVERPRLWYLVAVFVGLGALQKAPIGLAFVAAGLFALWLARRVAGAEWAQMTASPVFRRAVGMALVLVVAWPLLQSARYGMNALSESHDRQMFARFLPDGKSGLRGFGEFQDLLIAGEPWLRWPAFLAVMVLPLLVRRPAAVMVTGVVIAYVVALMVAGGNVYARYTVTILPLMMAALAVGLMHLRPAPWAGLFTGVLLLALSGGPFLYDDVRKAALQPAIVAGQVEVLRTLGAEIRPDETLVFCWSRGVRRLIPGAVSTYASNGKKIVVAADFTRDHEVIGGPFRGVCPATEIGQVEPIMRGFAVVLEEAGYVVWTADGLR